MTERRRSTVPPTALGFKVPEKKKESLPTTRTEWTIEVNDSLGFTGESLYLVPMMGGRLDVTKERLRDLQEGGGPPYYRLVSREVTTTEWKAK